MTSYKSIFNRRRIVTVLTRVGIGSIGLLIVSAGAISIAGSIVSGKVRSQFLSIFISPALN